MGNHYHLVLKTGDGDRWPDCKAAWPGTTTGAIVISVSSGSGKAVMGATYLIAELLRIVARSYPQ